MCYLCLSASICGKFYFKNNYLRQFWQRLNRRCQRRDDLAVIAHYAKFRFAKDRRVLIRIYRDNGLGVAAARQMMARAGDADRNIQLWRDCFAGESNLHGV